MARRLTSEAITGHDTPARGKLGLLADEGTPAVERYLELLAAGGSDYPLDLLRRAGVDLATPEPVRSALAEFAAIVDEMERLVEAGAPTGAG